MTGSDLALQADVLIAPMDSADAVVADVLALTHPISFWGGVDPETGRIIDARHPQRGETVSGRILVLPGTIGSSSAAAVMLELVHARLAPAAILMHEADAILLLGCVVAREMGWVAPPAYRLPRDRQAGLAGRRLRVEAGGRITPA